MEGQEKIIIKLYLIPDAEYICFKVNKNIIFKEIMNNFFDKYNISRNEYKLFICNYNQLKPDSFKTMEEIKNILKIQSEEILIYAIKGI